MTIPGLNDATIRAGTAPSSYARGEQYFNEGAVLMVKPRGENGLEAFVQGNHGAPYVVRIGYNKGHVSYVECTCPYHTGSWCKHVVAVLLACRNNSEIPETTALSALLDGMDREALVSLIHRLVHQNPTLAHRLIQDNGLNQ